MRYSWPGNVRELENVIEQICVLHDKQRIETQDLPLDILNEVVYIPTKVSQATSQSSKLKPLSEMVRETVETSERGAVEKALLTTSGNKKEAAKLLGISRVTLYEKIRKYGISVKRT
jgi:DNA-binding NtrC family response regulator